LATGEQRGLIPRIDPAQPWLAPLQPVLPGALNALAQGCTVAQALNQQCAAVHQRPRVAAGWVRFVPQAELPQGMAYEAFIHASAQVPTRDNLHDLFNGLMWLTQPETKRRLNALQAEQMALAGVGAARGAVRDALTLMDENGALLQGPAALHDALQARDWRALFGAHRGLWAQASLQVFGHALLDKLCTAPRKGLCAHVLCGDALTMPVAHWAQKPFEPLPVLGIPGWWPANEAPGFYDDTAVFRPRRSAFT
jgi:hypothetical protein